MSNCNADPLLLCSSTPPTGKKHIQKKVTEYALPATVQTHEITSPLHRSDILLITQQECNGIVKVTLNEKGRPTSAVKSILRNNSYEGAHGLFPSKRYRNQIWVTLQFSSILLLIDPTCDQLEVVKEIHLPSPLKGPHTVIEDGEDLWVACKDSHHVARVKHCTEDYKAYKCGRRPICIAKAGKCVYASLDQSSKIFCLDLCTEETTELDIPADKGNTPVGLVADPDGRAVWFVLLGGQGVFGRILGKEISWFQLNIPRGTLAGLLHLAFDKRNPLKIWLLASSLAKSTGVHSHKNPHQDHQQAPQEAGSFDAVFTVVMEDQFMRIVSEETIMLPTQPCLAHRVFPHDKGIFVTELGVSALAHITGMAFAGGYDEAADNYALWGLGVKDNNVQYSYSSPYEPRKRPHK